MSLTQALLAILATWRLTSLLHQERGPWAILEKLRHLAGVRWNEFSAEAATTELAEGLLCVWCVSVWMGALVAVTAALLGWCGWWETPLMALAFSAGAILINGMLEGESNGTTI